MLRVFVGEDRLAAEEALKRILGADYEVFEGEDLSPADLPSIFQGTSLFGTKRKILLKNLTENKSVWEKIADYFETEHEIVVWESKIDKRSVVYKALKAEKIEIREFIPKRSADAGLVFGIFETALGDGKRAVEMLEKIELQQDPYMFFGLMVTQALKKLDARQGRRERMIVKELAKVDMQLKTTPVEPWLLVKSFLLEISSL